MSSGDGLSGIGGWYKLRVARQVGLHSGLEPAETEIEVVIVRIRTRKQAWVSYATTSLLVENTPPG